MIISDLNYLEITSEEVIGGGNYSQPTPAAPKPSSVLPSFSETIIVNKNIVSILQVVGNTGTASAGATATGNNTVAQAGTLTATTTTSSSANAGSLSGTGSYWY